MKKIYLLAGFFILTSTSQSFAYSTKDTLPNKSPQYCKLNNTDLRPSFLQWIKSQWESSRTNNSTIDFRSYVSFQSQDSTIHFSWWPQAVKLNDVQRRLSEYPLAGLPNDFYKWFVLHRQ